MDEVADVREEMDGPGVVGGEEGIGGGENDAERWRLGMTIWGLACQKEDACARGMGSVAFFGATAAGAAVEEDALGCAGLSVALGAGLTRFLSALSLSFSFSRSLRSFFSRFLSLRAWSSSSVGLGMETPFNRLVSTSR